MCVRLNVSIDAIYSIGYYSLYYIHYSDDKVILIYNTAILACVY